MKPGAAQTPAQRRPSKELWTSALSLADHGTSLSSGFEAAGVVQGMAVMQWGWNSQMGFGLGSAFPSGNDDTYVENWRCPHGFVSGEHRAIGSNFEQPWVEETWSQGWHLAFQRMMEEAEVIGAHGVIGVTDEMHPLKGTGAVEFLCRGTAVFTTKGELSGTIFSTFLAGQRLRKLFESGYVPVSVVGTLSSVRMMSYCLTHYQLTGQAAGMWAGAMSGGIAGSHSIVQVNLAEEAARRLARARIRAEISGGELHGVTFDISTRNIGEGDFVFECLLKGNHVRRIADPVFVEIPESVLHLS